MNDNQARKIVQDEIRKNGAKSRFSLRSIPIHTHNNIDSVPIYSPTFTYAGFVDGDTPANPVFSFLPQGWTVVLFGSGYKVTHNLGSTLYSVQCCQTGPSATISTPVTAASADSFTVVWIKTDATATLQTFHFVVTIINNKSTPLPKYSTIGV